MPIRGRGFNVTGSNQFQTEYIEYLQKCNTELLNKINQMKESYENKILSKDLNKEYLISTLEDVLNIFTVIPHEIDLFFEKITAAVGAFRNILLRKSEMVRLMERISKVLNNNENFNKLLPIDDPVLMKDDIPEATINKKAGTVKVSPMINGHVISTEPRIYLSRMPGLFTSDRRIERHQLSPIIEASPDTSPDLSSLGCHVLKEIKIPLERVNINKMPCNYISEESPKTRFKGPKLWKKSFSSNKCQSECQRKSIFSENSENLNKKMSIGGNGEVAANRESDDPLEGPSWLYKENSDSSLSNHFINYRRRKHRFATVFDKDEDFCTYVEKKPRKSLRQDSKEFHKNHNEARDVEENLEAKKERVSESSEDFISTSFSSAGSEPYSPSEKTHQRKRRKRTEQPSDGKVMTEFDSELIKETSKGKNEKKKSMSKTPVYSDSSDEEEMQSKKFSGKSTKNRNSSGKRLNSLHGRMSTELSFEKTCRRSEFPDSEIRSKRSRDSKRKSTSLKDELENVASAQVDDCWNEEKMLPKRSRTSEKKKSKRSKPKSKSRSPAIIFPQTEGRIKRKAAPTVLKEPLLTTKLRRS